MEKHNINFSRRQIRLPTKKPWKNVHVCYINDDEDISLSLQDKRTLGKSQLYSTKAARNC